MLIFALQGDHWTQPNENSTSCQYESLREWTAVPYSWSTYIEVRKLNNISDTGFLVNKTDETGGMGGNHIFQK